MIIMLLLWVATLAGAVYLARRVWEAYGHKLRLPQFEIDALELAKRRYASGEIDRDQYLAIKQELAGVEQG
ncbi:SHOCT domain-containing protein [Sporomusa sp.]|uniref:SHOCT domain-containing protein n=1 Tax=Sporomusa sp. TaxID=2078658 RepID=UPI002C08EEBE|nr:SHOCT domain-containing protein [Sporomusa sp.]HWR43457.1 SHOCT domain-containing protein [Sporomusa sp.]